jgi:trimeric autotransporter adhesin
VFEVPIDLLTKGTNVISASTHLNWRATPDISFHLTMEAERSGAGSSR